MALLFQEVVERSDLEAGDHIYSWRKHLYSHHGIFVGEDNVIHFVNTRVGEGEGEGGGGRRSRFLAAFSSSSSGGGAQQKQKQKAPCPKPYCGQEKVAGSGVKESCIDCFVKKGSLYRFKYEVSLEFLVAEMVGGSCTMAASDPPDDVIHRATYLYENGYGKYDLMNNNCEDFALYCKTGLWSTDKDYQGRSSQANMVHSTSRPDKENSMGKRLQEMATAVPRSFSKRANKDLGARTDVVKLPVEELSSFILSLKKTSSH